MTYIMGINDSHCATACLLKDGTVVACASEERFTRKKLQPGFPTRSSRYCLKQAGITPGEVDLLVYSWRDLASYQPVPSDRPGLAFNWFNAIVNLMGRSDLPRGLLERAYDFALPTLGALNRQTRARVASSELGVEPDRIRFVDHHLAHAYSAIFSSPFPKRGEDAVVITCDARGDRDCAAVFTYKTGKITEVRRTYYTNSLGALYSSATEVLGMKSLFDEHKVMGLAGYVSDSRNLREYRMVHDLIELTPDLSFKSSVSYYSFTDVLRQIFAFSRFDRIAAAVQQFTEDLIVKLVGSAMRVTGLSSVALGGGTFMNIKANMEIAKLPQLTHVFAMPSAGDESTAVGAAYWGYLGLKPDGVIEPIESIYWGPGFEKDYIEGVLEHNRGKGWKVELVDGIEDEVASLISKGEIVARFDGRMEFGARALGNRSILADASKPSLATKINRAVKQRDFWMPFAPVISRGSERSYLESPDPLKVNDQYMMFAFHSTPLAGKDLIAAMHPYDGSLRPQVIDPEWNPGYHGILERYGELTGRHGLLNTSLNLHGDAMVCSPEDALLTFENSGLNYIALGEYMVSKS